MAGEVEGGDRARPRRPATTARRRAPPRRARGAAAAAGRRRAGAGAGRASTRLWTSSVITRHVLLRRDRAPARRRGRAASMCTKWPTSSRISQRPPGGRYGSTRSGSVPHPISSGCAAEDGEERHRQPGQPQQRPLRAPRPEAAEAHRRVDLPAPAVVVLAGADRRRGSAATSGDSRGFMRPRRARQLVERARLARRRSTCAGGARASRRSRRPSSSCACARRRRGCGSGTGCRRG